MSRCSCEHGGLGGPLLRCSRGGSGFALRGRSWFLGPESELAVFLCALQRGCRAREMPWWRPWTERGPASERLLARPTAPLRRLSRRRSLSESAGAVEGLCSSYPGRAHTSRPPAHKAPLAADRVRTFSWRRIPRRSPLAFDGPGAPAVAHASRVGSRRRGGALPAQAGGDSGETTGGAADGPAGGRGASRGWLDAGLGGGALSEACRARGAAQDRAPGVGTEAAGGTWRHVPP